MKHLAKGRKLKREKSQRDALLRGLFRALIEKEKILTTEAKAKELRPFAEKLISKAKENNLGNRRFVAKHLGGDNLKKLFNAIGPKYKERSGGYLRVIKSGFRPGDSVKTAIVEFV